MKRFEIAGFPGYSVSLRGVVYGKRFNRPLTFQMSNAGYKRVALYRNGVRLRVALHRLVVECILGVKLKRGMVVHHIDGNRKNCSAGNLQIVSQRYNVLANVPF